MLHYGFLLLLPAAFTLVHLARRRARKTSLVAMVLAGLGAGLSGLVAVDAYDVALANACRWTRRCGSGTRPAATSRAC